MKTSNYSSLELTRSGVCFDGISRAIVDARICDNVPLKRDVKLGRGDRVRTVAVQTKWRYVILKRPSCRIVRNEKHRVTERASCAYFCPRFTCRRRVANPSRPCNMHRNNLSVLFLRALCRRCLSSQPATGSRPTGNHVTIKEPNRRSLFTEGIKLRDRGTILHGGKQRRR